MAEEGDQLVTTSHWHRESRLETRFLAHSGILYFGNWRNFPNQEDCHHSNSQYSAFEFAFRGPLVRWIGSRDHSHGMADVFIDGIFRQTVDSYAPTRQTNVIKYSAQGLSGDRIHTLRVVVRKERNAAATDCFQDVASIECPEPLSYPVEMARMMALEYRTIQDGTHAYLQPGNWHPVANRAMVPTTGVTLAEGIFLSAFNANLLYLNHCFASPTYCDGPGWAPWLPASNEGRMLAGAAGALRWGERSDMRKIVDTILADIDARMRDDGYYNYYAEEDSYALQFGSNSERKNYDRVFWTRGLLAAGLVGKTQAYDLLRRMYDWFNQSPYLPWMLLGSNTTNGLPGGPLVHLSPVGCEEDLLVTERYYDQDYWMRELALKQPLAIACYPGERPHCYDLLAFETLIDEYRATGADKYLESALGAWEIYRDNYKHIGGATAICEEIGRTEPPYPPRSYYIATGHNGELCGSVFWININSKLLQLFPDCETYAAEIEEALYNVVAAAIDERGYRRYHARLHYRKESARCLNTCCEVSSTGLLGRLPELIYATADTGLYVNLYVPSTITWQQDGDDVTLTTDTRFPVHPGVAVTIYTAAPKWMHIRLRIPNWLEQAVTVNVAGVEEVTGEPGSYLSIAREWSTGDCIEFDLPISPMAVKYTGLDQVAGNLDRYALMAGPVLMALQCELANREEIPRLALKGNQLVDLLQPVKDAPLQYDVSGHPGYRYVPYWMIQDETFSCFPIVEEE